MAHRARRPRALGVYGRLPDPPRAIVEWERDRMSKMLHQMEELIAYADDQRFIVQSQEPM